MADTEMPKVGEKAPSFELPVYPGGKKLKLSQFRSKKNVVLYFYPKDDTPGCTKEACGFRDTHAHLELADTVVLGVSGDSLKSHEKFATKHELPFPLLSDENHEVCQKYGVWVEKSMYGRKYMGIERSTFLIDGKGRIARQWRKVKVKVKGHAAEVLAAAEALGR